MPNLHHYQLGHYIDWIPNKEVKTRLPPRTKIKHEMAQNNRPTVGGNLKIDPSKNRSRWAGLCPYMGIWFIFLFCFAHYHIQMYCIPWRGMSSKLASYSYSFSTSSSASSIASYSYSFSASSSASSVASHSYSFSALSSASSCHFFLYRSIRLQKVSN